MEVSNITPATLCTLSADVKRLLNECFPQSELDSCDDDSTSDAVTSVRNQFHSLGPVNLYEAHSRMVKLTERMRAVTNHHLNTTIKPSLRQPGTEALTKRYVTLAKEESNLAATLYDTKHVLRECQEVLTEACCKHDPLLRSQLLVKRIKSMGEELGLETFTDTSTHDKTMITTVTICGDIIVADIEIESSGEIRKVNIEYASGTWQDERVDRILADNLRNQDFTGFRKNLEALAVLDRFGKEFRASGVDFFHAVACVENDMRNIFQREMEMFCGDIEKVLLHGHGLYLKNVVHPGPSIAYWAPKSKLADMDWDSIRNLLSQNSKASGDQGGIASEKDEMYAMGGVLAETCCRLGISMERTLQPFPFLASNERDNYLLLPGEDEHNLFGEKSRYELVKESLSHCKTTTGDIVEDPPLFPFLRPKTVGDDAPCAANARYVAFLDPPAVVTEGTARWLQGTFHAKDDTLVPGSLPISAEPVPKGTASLQEMLVCDAIKKWEESHAHEEKGTAKEALENTSIWEMSAPSDADGVAMPTMTFSLVGQHHLARLIHRIPFLHPCQMRSIVQILRQEAVFTALFKSCFNWETYVSPAEQEMKSRRTEISLDDLIKPTESAALPLHVEIQTPNPPNKLILSFYNPTDQTPVYFEINIDQCTALPSVKTVADGSLTPHLDARLTETLRRTESIPELLKWMASDGWKVGCGISKLNGESSNVGGDTEMIDSNVVDGGGGDRKRRRA